METEEGRFLESHAGKRRVAETAWCDLRSKESAQGDSSAKRDFTDRMWRAVSEAADRRHEILVRHRIGRGVWYASVEVIHRDATHHSGQSILGIQERCASKQGAELAARRLLAENAKHFSAEMFVQPEVVCELEWEIEDDNRSKTPAE